MRRSVYQMTTTKVRTHGEGNCGTATDRGKEACECMGKYRVCRLPSVHHSPLDCIHTESARLRTETSYKAGPAGEQAQHCEAQCLSVDQVMDELVQRKSMLLSGEIYTAPGSKSSRRLKGGIVKCCVLRIVDLGGDLQDSVDEFLSFEEGDDMRMAIQTTPFARRCIRQLKHHH